MLLSSAARWVLWAGWGRYPLLVLVWAGWPQMTAQGINLLMILPVGLLGLYFHRKNGLTDGKAAWPLLLGGLPRVLLGVLLGTRLGENTLRAASGDSSCCWPRGNYGWVCRPSAGMAGDSVPRRTAKNPGRCARGPQAKPSSGRLLWAPPTAAMLRIAGRGPPALPPCIIRPRMVNNSIDSFSRTTTL